MGRVTARTTIRLRISPRAARGPLTLGVIDPAGRMVRDLMPELPTVGLGRLSWDGRDARDHPVAAGVYYVRLTSVDGTSSARMVVVR